MGITEYLPLILQDASIINMGSHMYMMMFALEKIG